MQMSVLLTRSENQILVLETLLKRLVQVCVHTQDKRLAKELKLMDFTRLVRFHASWSREWRAARGSTLGRSRSHAPGTQTARCRAPSTETRLS